MRKGSITIYLALILCVILSLVYAAMDSARYSCGRAMVSFAAEEGLFSLFGEYDRMIYDRYGLLLVDGGYESPELKAGVLLEEAESVMRTVLFQDKNGRSFPSSDPFRIDTERFSVTGYVLATDSGGEMLRKQIHDLMIPKTGMNILNFFNDYSEILGASEDSSFDRMDRLKAEYEDQVKAAEEERKQKESSGDPAAPVEKTELPDDFENPIDVIFRLKKLGILAAVVPDVSELSAGSVKIDQMPSSRKLAEGFGILPQSQASFTDAFLLAEYLTDYFPCFTDKTAVNDFQYQAEYAVAGKSTDIENLKSVLNRLLAIRETLNFLYLCSDAEKSAEAESMALMLTSAVLLPELTPLVSVILMLCWAYGESLLDLKTLLAGGKVPVMKDAGTFHLSLWNLSALQADAKTLNTGKGMDYKDYLTVLLMMKGNSKLMDAVLDLLETNRRKEEGAENFSIDTCVCAFEMQVEGEIGGHDYVLTKGYGYDPGS